MTELCEANADPLTPAEFRLLAEIGFVAAGRGWLEQASQVFDALIAIAPQRTLPHIGLALALLNGQQPDAAIRVLERAEKMACSSDAGHSEPAVSDLRDDSALIRAFYGVALKLSGRTSESFRILQGLCARPSADHAGRIARSMLGMAEPEENQT